MAVVNKMCKLDSNASAELHIIIVITHLICPLVTWHCVISLFFVILCDYWAISTVAKINTVTLFYFV